MRTLVWMLAVACSAPPVTPQPPSPPPPAPTPTPAPAARAAVTTKRVVVSGSRKSGTFDMTVEPDGSITTKLVVIQNGRGPRVDAHETFNRDGSLATWTATGQHEMGTKFTETFGRDGDFLRWHSESETGEHRIRGIGPYMFVPIATAPDMLGHIVLAAMPQAGDLPLLPAGRAAVKRVAHATVTIAGKPSELTLCSIRGLDLAPLFTWMNADGSWFGTTQPYMSVVPEGTESVVDTLIAKQTEVERGLDAELAKQHAHAPPAEGLAYTHARVLDVAKHKWNVDYTVVVAGDTIKSVGPSKTTKVPDGAEVVDLAGKAVIPGLVDMHSHLGGADGVLDIASGVTTARDVGNDPDKLDDMKARFDAGTAIGPHVVRMGFIEGRGDKAAGSKITAETADEAAAAVEFYAKRGYEGIKIYNSVKVELVPVLAKLAHGKGMRVTGHIPVHMLAHEAVDAGYDGIEHVNMLFLNFFATHDTDTRDTTRFTLVGEHAAELDLASKPVQDLFSQFRKHGTVIDPTLDAFEDLFVGEMGKISPGLEDTVARLPVQTQRGFLLGGLPLSGDRQTKYRAAWQRMLAMVKALHDAKVAVVVGTDHIGGVMLHHEMELFARAGVDPGTILEDATLGAARAMGRERAIGSIAPNKRADLVVIDGDPLADIHAIHNVVTTMRSGIVYPSAPLYESAGVKAR